MLINLDNLFWNSKRLRSLSDELTAKGNATYPVISSGFSTIPGISEVGGIHARAIAGDPASAADQLKNLSTSADPSRPVGINRA